MKVSNEHLEKLKQECFKILQDHDLHPFMVQNDHQAWECFHAAKAYWMYDCGYTDSNIRTALRKIFK